jgi:SAM-dependent methyltransferase
VIHRLRQAAVERGRAALRRVVRSEKGRRAVVAAQRELNLAMDTGMYGPAYFGAGRDPSSRMGLSGFEESTRATSNADVSAYLIWRYLNPRTSMDVGCGKGFLVEALHELGVDSRGIDFSFFAVDNPALGAKGRLRWGDVTDRLPLRDGSFEVVSALETLEHLPPESVPKAIAELRRVTRSWLVCTIPSFGPNANGPGGWLDVKVLPERLEHYKALGPDFEGPVPLEDLNRDAAGNPLEGHLTIASFAWWTKRFEEAGLVRCGEVERRMHPDLARFGLTKYWNLYVLRTPETPVPAADLHPPAKVDEVEQRWHLNERAFDPDDVRAVEDALRS